MAGRKYPSPLAGVSRDTPLPTDKAADGKSLMNPPQHAPSESYQHFLELYDTEQRGALLWDRPIGPHPSAMFEVSVFTPAQFGAFIPWLAVWRGPLPVLVHPNTLPEDGETLAAAELRDHTERAIWLGEEQSLDLRIFS
ncbi:hypothetical protein PWT90_05959 [Aphanocladium album]|nr:hypothetical protein PWT90_05959 [Aphanocladium album]